MAALLCGCYARKEASAVVSNIADISEARADLPLAAIWHLIEGLVGRTELSARGPNPGTVGHKPFIGWRWEDGWYSGYTHYSDGDSSSITTHRNKTEKLTSGRRKAGYQEHLLPHKRAELREV